MFPFTHERGRNWEVLSEWWIDIWLKCIWDGCETHDPQTLPCKCIMYFSLLSILFIFAPGKMNIWRKEIWLEKKRKKRWKEEGREGRSEGERGEERKRKRWLFQEIKFSCSFSSEWIQIVYMYKNFHYLYTNSCFSPVYVRRIP